MSPEPASRPDIGARTYDPTTGCFLQVDPDLNTSDPVSLNGYTYGDDNPIPHPDPTGTRAIGDPGDGGSATGELPGGGVPHGTGAPAPPGSGGWDAPPSAQPGQKQVDYGRQTGRQCGSSTTHDRVCQAAAQLLLQQGNALNYPGNYQVYLDMQIPHASKNCTNANYLLCNAGYADIVIVYLYASPDGPIAQAFVWEVKALGQDRPSAKGGTAAAQAARYAQLLMDAGKIRIDGQNVPIGSAEAGWRAGGPYGLDNNTMYWGADPGEIIYANRNDSRAQARIDSRAVTGSHNGPLDPPTNWNGPLNNGQAAQNVVANNPEYLICPPSK